MEKEYVAKKNDGENSHGERKEEEKGRKSIGTGNTQIIMFDDYFIT